MSEKHRLLIYRHNRITDAQTHGSRLVGPATLCLAEAGTPYRSLLSGPRYHHDIGSGQEIVAAEPGECFDGGVEYRALPEEKKKSGVLVYPVASLCREMHASIQSPPQKNHRHETILSPNDLPTLIGL